MKRVGMTWLVDAAHWEEYKAIHLNPWPELLELIQEFGIHNYNIFAMPPEETATDRRVFAYLEIEGDDLNQVLDALAQTDVKEKWDKQVTIWVMPEATEGSGIQFMELERIFYCP